MNLEIIKKKEIESELEILIKNGKTKEEATSILMDKYGEENANYIIEAYLMPLDEITKEIERYDNSKNIDELAFIKELCTRYNVDKKAIIERIQNVRRINKQKSFETPERLERLKNRRDNLQKQRDKLFDKTMDKEEKSMFYFELGVVTIVSGILFYPASPVLAGIIPVIYAVALPSIRNTLMLKKQYNLTDELVDLGKEIEYLDIELNKNKEISNIQKNMKEEKNKDNINRNINQTSNDNILEYEIECKEENVDISLLEPYLEEDIEDDVVEGSIEGPTLVKRRNK